MELAEIQEFQEMKKNEKKIFAPKLFPKEFNRLCQFEQ